MHAVDFCVCHIACVDRHSRAYVSRGKWIFVKLYCIFCMSLTFASDMCALESRECISCAPRMERWTAGKEINTRGHEIANECKWNRICRNYCADVNQWSHNNRQVVLNGHTVALLEKNIIFIDCFASASHRMAANQLKSDDDVSHFSSFRVIAFMLC